MTNTKFMTTFRQIRLYPFLIAAYPAVALLSANLGEARLVALVRPLMASIGIAALLYAAIWRVLRDSDRAAALATWLLLLFFSYGHFYDLLRNVRFDGLRPGRHLLLFPAWVLAGVISSFVILRSHPSRTVSAAFTVFALAALAQPALRIITYQARSAALYGEAAEAVIDEPGVVPPLSMDQTPDIYYIVLDGYARHDVMSDVFGFDNTPFIEDLRQMGFVIAPCGQSNYTKTQLSLASSLNFEYLETLHPLPDPDSADTTWLPPLIQASRLRRLLEAHGYQTIAFETGFPFTEIVDADLYLTPASSEKYRVRGLSAFEEMFLRSTAGVFAIEGLAALPWTSTARLTGAERWKRNNVLFTLDALEELATLPGPKFVFAHVVAPHGPFVFGPDGEPVHSPDEDTAPREDILRAYADQARFVSDRMVMVLRAIQSASSAPPVIVVQADHAPDFSTPDDNVRILNALLFPGAARDVYPGLTPVNSFRLVLNQLGRNELPLLDDISYYSRGGEPFDFTVIPPSCEES